MEQIEAGSETQTASPAAILGPDPLILRVDLDNPDDALEREWLCTNGLGGYAMGTVAGANTRRYHGLLVPALTPPVGRRVLCAKVDESFQTGSEVTHLGANEFADGTRAPWGVQHLESFRLEGARPTWSYLVPGGVLEKSIWMVHGHSITCLRYLSRGTGGRLRLAFFATDRDYHHETRGSVEWRFQVTPLAAGAEITAFPGATPWRIQGPPGACFVPVCDWWWRFHHRQERARGLDCEEDLFLAGTLEVPLSPGEPVLVALSAGPPPPDGAGDPCFPDRDWHRQQARETRLVALAGGGTDPLRARLALAADQFLVRRGPAPQDEAGTILAGYPWFTDWGRDTMIALPGLTLTTGRHAEARRILTTYAQFLDRGMLPNRFPDGDQVPEYNTVDATLWFFQAVAAYVAASNDESLVAELFPALDEIVAWHLCGTRYGIGVDPKDGLLRAGEEGTQLTWMDAKIGDWVVTPRQGKPVEINALWYNALRHMDYWARRLGRPPAPRGTYGDTYTDLAARALESFTARFWHSGNYLCDVVDTPQGTDDPSIRPNQIFAVSLPYPALTGRRAQIMVATVRRHLLTPFGLRTLSPTDPNYRGRYGGNPWQRDSAYHQGTVWPWLLSGYAGARRRFGASAAEISALRRGLVHHLGQTGVGSISEVFDGDPPHHPGGCPAQAWSVAALLSTLD